MVYIHEGQSGMLAVSHDTTHIRVGNKSANLGSATRRYVVVLQDISDIIGLNCLADSQSGQALLDWIYV